MNTNSRQSFTFWLLSLVLREPPPHLATLTLYSPAVRHTASARRARSSCSQAGWSQGYRSRPASYLSRPHIFPYRVYCMYVPLLERSPYPLRHTCFPFGERLGRVKPRAKTDSTEAGLRERRARARASICRMLLSYHMVVCSVATFGLQHVCYIHCCTYLSE